MYKAWRLIVLTVWTGLLILSLVMLGRQNWLEAFFALAAFSAVYAYLEKHES